MTPPLNAAPTALLNRRHLMTAVASAALLSACSLAPRQTMAPMDVPAAWRSTATAPGWVNADDARRWQQGTWWALWGDSVLTDLVERVNVSNQTLAVAIANVVQAEALLAQQQASLWPTLGAQLGAQRSGNGSAATGSSSANLNAAWTPDLWGRLREGTKAQAAQVQASQADLAAARLSVQSAVANAYLALREADAEIALLDDIITAYTRNTTITQNRYNAGVVARTDLLQAQSTLANARASREALTRSRATYEHAIAVLLGLPPASFSLPAQPAAAWRSTVPTVPTDVPAALLLRRPDVARTERAVAAANAQIGVARAAYFPNLALNASTGLGASSIASLFNASNVLWSLGLSLAQTLFDAGARNAQVNQALAARDGAIANYRQTALTAMQQVEDQLTALETLARQIEQVRAAADAATKVEQQMMNRYQAGIAAYTDVITSQTAALSARRSVLQLQLQRQQAAVALIVALGGGWQAPWAAADAPPVMRRVEIN